MKHRLIRRIITIEIYEVEAESEADAQERLDSGELSPIASKIVDEEDSDWVQP